MSNVLRFPIEQAQPRRDPAVTPPGMTRGEVLLFTGIRYMRGPACAAEPAACPPPPEKRQV